MMKKILCVVLMGILGLSGSLWAVDTPMREKPSFSFSDNEEEGGEIETKDEPAEEGMDVAAQGAALSAVYYQEEDGSIYLNLEGIPCEVWMAILGFLDLSDLGWFAQVSHFFYELIQDEEVLGPIEVWPHYAGLSRFPGNDKSALNANLLGMVSSYRDLIDGGHALYLLKRFVEWGAALDMEDFLGKTPLHKAVMFRHVDVVRLLLDFGAAWDARDNNGITPLHGAAMFGRGDVVRLLLDLGGAPDVRSDLGKTPLHWAAMFGHVGLVRLLLDFGAALDVRDNNGRTPLDLAAERGYVAVVRLLENYGAGVNEEVAPDLAPVPRVEQVDVARDGNAIDVGAFYNNGLGLTREQLLAYLVFLGALTTYSTGCNLL